MAKVEFTTMSSETAIDPVNDYLLGYDNSEGAGNKFTPSNIFAAFQQKGSDIASAGTISIGQGEYFFVTGTTTITDIDFAVDFNGRKAWLKFAGALTLTHNSTSLILPTGANITTAAGDVCLVVSEGSDNVRILNYMRASGAALAGGSAIGGAVSGGTAKSLLYVDGSGNLAQDNSKLQWDDGVQFLVKVTNEAAAPAGAFKFQFDGATTGYTTGLVIESTSATGYYPEHIRLKNTAYATSSTIKVADVPGLYFDAGLNALWDFSSGSGGGANRVAISTNDSNPMLKVVSDAAQLAFLVKLAASQSANALEIQPSASSTPLTFFDKNGAWGPASMANATAPNNSVFYSTTNSKLVYKDSGGTVNNLY